MKFEQLQLNNAWKEERSKAFKKDGRVKAPIRVHSTAQLKLAKHKAKYPHLYGLDKEQDK